MLARCTGPTLDLGCGPGRLVAALSARGLPVLGVDISPEAVLRTLTRGGMALHRDALAPLPGEGRWRHVLLADGNIGIGGDPIRLLRRVAGLLEPGGTALVELATSGGLWRGGARLESPDSISPWFPWAQVDLGTLSQLVPAAGFTIQSTRRGLRSFAELGDAS
jgi:SAM-dependent methyltransferase